MAKRKPKAYEPLPDDEVDDPVSEYVVFLLWECIKEGVELTKLGLSAGLVPSQCSQMKDRKITVTQKSASKLAPHLGYADYRDLVNAAYDWWTGDRTRRPDGGHVSPLRAALQDAAREHGYSRAEVDTAWLVASKIRGDVVASPEQAGELLSRARLFIKDGTRSLAPANDSPATTAGQKTKH